MPVGRPDSRQSASPHAAPPRARGRARRRGSPGSGAVGFPCRRPSPTPTYLGSQGEWPHAAPSPISGPPSTGRIMLTRPDARRDRCVPSGAVAAHLGVSERRVEDARAGAAALLEAEEAAEVAAPQAGVDLDTGQPGRVGEERICRSSPGVPAPPARSASPVARRGDAAGVVSGGFSSPTRTPPPRRHGRPHARPFRPGHDGAGRHRPRVSRRQVTTPGRTGEARRAGAARP